MDSHMFDGLIPFLLLIGATIGVVGCLGVSFVASHLTLGWSW